MRSFVEQRLPQAARESGTVTVPASASITEIKNLSVEILTGHIASHYQYFWFREAAGSMSAIVLNVRVRDPMFPGPPGYVSGAGVQAFGLSKRSFKALGTQLSLLSRTELVQRNGAIGRLAADVAAGRGLGHIRVDTNNHLVFEHGVPGKPLSQLAPSLLGARARARLLYELIRQTQRTWKTREVTPADTKAICRRVLDSVNGGAEFGLRYRVLALAGLDYRPALPILRKLPQTRYVKTAIRLLTISGRCGAGLEPPEELLESFVSSDPWIANWARTTARRAYPERYDAVFGAVFVRMKGRRERIRLIQEWEQHGAGRRGLANLALADPLAEVRVEAARALGDGEVLVSVAKAKNLVAESDFDARRSAIIYLTWGLNPPGDPRLATETLFALMKDKTEDVRIRQRAAQGLGDIMSRASAVELIELLEESVPIAPVYLTNQPRIGVAEYLQLDDVRIGAARALGSLRAKAAVPALVRTLDRRAGRQLRRRILTALALIGDERAMAYLRGLREDGSEDVKDAVELGEVILKRDLEGVLRLASGSPRTLVSLLADLFPVAELETGQESKEPRTRELLQAAMELRGARENR